MSYFKQELRLLWSRLTGNYITNKLTGNYKQYTEIYKEAINFKYPIVDEFLKAYKNIDEKWLNELALQTKITIKKSKINFQHGKL